MSEELTKAAVLDRIKRGRARLNDVLAKFSEVERSAVVVQERWTIKDMLAHLAAWETDAARWVSAGARGENPGVPVFTDDSVNEFNARVHSEHLYRPLAEVEADFERSTQALIAAVEALPDDPNDPRYAVWGRYRNPWQLVAGNSFEHYDEHLPALEAWLVENGR